MEIPTIEPCPCGECQKVVVKPYFYGENASISREEANEIVNAFRDAARWQHVKANAHHLRVLQHKKMEERDEWIDTRIKETS